MKKHTTLKSKFNSAFSLVELLVVIAVIAVIAAIAIPNISDITGGARTAADKRTAQNIASVYSAYVAAGGTFDGTGKSAIISELEVGKQVNVAGQNVSFTVGELSDENTGYLTYLSDALRYTP